MSSSASTTGKDGGRTRTSVALEQWQDAVQQTLNSMEFKHAAMARPLGDQWELALITYRDAGTHGEQDMTEFVNFAKTDDAGNSIKPTLTKAQLVRTDAMNRIVFSTTKFRPWTNFVERGAAVILPACGAHMRKEKALLREHMPPEALRMRSLCQQYFSSEPGLRCHWCQTSEPRPQRCYLCLLGYHEECCVQVVRNATAPKVQTRCTISDIFGDEQTQCKVCHDWVISNWSHCQGKAE